MTRRGSEAARRLAAALAPAAALLLMLAMLDLVAAGPALALATLLVAGAIWFVVGHGHIADSGMAPEAAADTPVPEAPRYDLLDPLPDPVLLLDRNRNVCAANAVARDLFGIGATGRDLARSIRHPAVLAAVETLLSGAPSLDEEIVLPAPVPRTFTMHAARLSPAGREPEAEDDPAILIVLHDETRARRAEQSRVDFVANVSHELRSPLSALIGFIETLRGPARNDAEARERFLEIMQREALRMAGLIEDLLSLSRVEINEHIPPSGHVELEPVLHDVAGTLGGRAGQRGMEILVDAPADLPAVTGDGDQLMQVFHNLVDNSIKYGRAGTPIRVTARPVDRMPVRGGPAVAITVSDVSDGIPAEKLPRITERFYRIDEGRSRTRGGTGLGLAIAKHIVNRHRGYLKIDSRLGEGSDFTVFLPAALPPRAGDRVALS